MLKVGHFVVSKGVDNPWVYRIKEFNPETNTANCQFVGHNGTMRPDKESTFKDKWKAIDEICMADMAQIKAAIGAPGDAHSNIVLKMNRMSAMLDGKLARKYSCQHAWVPYIGFRESYQFCTNCPAKKGIDDT